jgi:hypothetical protein
MVEERKHTNWPQRVGKKKGQEEITYPNLQINVYKKKGG